MPWISTETGDESAEDSDEPSVWFEPWELPTEPPTINGESYPDDSWIPDWLGLELAEVEVEQKALKKQYERGVARGLARKKYLEFVYLRRAEAVVERDLAQQKGKKKSVDYEHTRCGFRTSKRVEVADEAVAIAHCLEHGYADAVKVKRSLLKSAIPKGVEVPGVSTVEQRKFYVKAG